MRSLGNSACGIERGAWWTVLSARPILCGLVCLLFATAPSPAHTVYLMNSNHTDYNWNATAATYDAAMLDELDYYLQQIADTAGNPPEEQARYTTDNWWWLWLYEKNRTPEQFQTLVDAMASGHIVVPLNPFVTLYGALPTEAVIRAGYYPGRMMRQHGIDFLLAENAENHTSPWGLASVWAGSGVRYTWKGICDCLQNNLDRMDDELFHWEGPDGQQVLFKWYELFSDSRDWGGYSETRDNLTSPAQLDAAITRTNDRMPGLDSTGLFGAGWDDVSWKSPAVLDAVQAYNAAGGTDRAVVSNGVDFFQALEANGDADLLNTLRGGWGNNWDQWPASLAERTARNRRAFERLHLAEALATLAQFHDQSFWPPVRDSLELGMVAAWKYFEHGWDVTSGGPSRAQMVQDKETWTQEWEAAVDGAVTAAEAVVAAQFETPDEDRVIVFNPLGFQRTEVARMPAEPETQYRVEDVETGLPVAIQLDNHDGVLTLSFLAADVPSLGWRTFRVLTGNFPEIAALDAASVDVVSRVVENGRHRVVIGTDGQIVSALHKTPEPDVELAGASGLSALGAGSIVAVSSENVGPVSATLRVDLTAPQRTVRITLYKEIDRIDIDNEITENVGGLRTYSFHAGLAGSQIRFEEAGAIARPGLVQEGGDFLDGTRGSRMQLNHFVDFALPDYHLVVSNADAFSMIVNDSGDLFFDLTGDMVHVIAMESPLFVTDQGGDDRFRNRFALRGIEGAFSAAEAMRTSLAHQNPLHVIPLPRNQSGPLAAAVQSLLSVDLPDVVVTALKPAEDVDGGYVVRVWEMAGQGALLRIDAAALAPGSAWETLLTETDVQSASVEDGALDISIGAHEIRTWRFTARVPIPVTVNRDDPSNGVLLSWSEGQPPFIVERATSPGAVANWTAITTDGGTGSYFFVDAGAQTGPQLLYYRVREPR